MAHSIHQRTRHVTRVQPRGAQRLRIIHAAAVLPRHCEHAAAAALPHHSRRARHRGVAAKGRKCSGHALRVAAFGNEIKLACQVALQLRHNPRQVRHAAVIAVVIAIIRGRCRACVVGVGGVAALARAAREARDEAQRHHVRSHRRRQARVLHLHCHVTPVGQRGAVHLRQAGGGGGDGVERRKELRCRRAELSAQRSVHLRKRPRRRGVLQRRQLRAVGAGQRGGGTKHLRSLDVDRAVGVT